jgi:hypothetical protein
LKLTIEGTMDEELYTHTVSGSAIEMVIGYNGEDSQKYYINIDGLLEANDLAIIKPGG